MEDTKASVVPATTEAPAAEQQPPAAEAPEAAPTPDWRTILESVDPKELAKHPRIAGILGSRLEAERKATEAERTRQARAQAQAEVDDELGKLLAENSEVLQEKYPKVFGHLSERKAQREEGESLKKFANRVGTAYNSIPEWQEATAEEKAGLAKKLAGVPDDDVVAVANAYVLDLVTTKRAEKQYSTRFKGDLEKERKAWDTERAAQDLKASERPDLTRGGKAPAAVNVNTMTDEEFALYWEGLKSGKRK